MACSCDGTVRYGAAAADAQTIHVLFGCVVPMLCWGLLWLWGTSASLCGAVCGRRVDSTPAEDRTAAAPQHTMVGSRAPPLLH